MILSAINFGNLSVEGYAAFILALVFTIVCIASAIYFAKHKHIGKFLSVLITIVFPFLAVFAWAYLILNIYEFPLALNLGYAFAAAGGYVVVAVCLALIINAIIKACKKKKAEKPQETVTQTVVTPVLIENTPVKQTVVEETVEEQPVEEVEEVEQPEEVEEPTFEYVPTQVEEVEEVEEEPVEQTVEEEHTEEPEFTFEPLTTEVEETAQPEEKEETVKTVETTAPVEEPVVEEIKVVETIEAPAKKRGRKKKEVVETPAAEQPAPAPARRGRPRKNRDVEVETVTPDETED